MRLRGDTAGAVGEGGRAGNSYRRAVKRDRSDIATLLALGCLEVEAESWGRAGVWLQRVLYIDLDHPEGHGLLDPGHLGIELQLPEAQHESRTGSVACDALGSRGNAVAEHEPGLVRDFHGCRREPW